MHVRDEQWGSIPILHIIKKELLETECPTVIFHHGFTSAKEHNLHYAYNLAKQGFRVLLPDAHLHGARAEEIDEVQMGLRFWEIILTSIEENQFLQTELVNRRLSQSDQIGVGGTSMGGITTLGSLVLYDWIRTGVVMMGTPGYVDFANAQISQYESGGFTLPISEEEKQGLLNNLAMFDLTKHPAALHGRPLFFWHGKKDLVVPFKPTFNFYQSIEKDYVSKPENLKFIVDKEAGHKVSRNGMLAAVDWFACHLNA